MTNKEKYHFKDFTQHEYRKLLQLAKQRYAFKGYTNYQEAKIPFVIWRHDIDFNLYYALQLAIIEQEEKVSATYYLLLHSNLYNLLSVTNKKIVQQIIALGHTIGLHFDSSYYNIQQEDDLEQYLTFEKKILEDTFQVPITSFSFHINTPFTMQCEKPTYAGMVNSYATYFKKELEYCSDSYGYWRFKRLEEVITNIPDKNLHILTHPEWWQESVKSPLQRLHDCVQQQATQMMKGDSDILQAINREYQYIDWE